VFVSVQYAGLKGEILGKMVELKITILESSDVEYWDEDSQSTVINHKAKYYFINGLGQYVYIHVRTRQEAEDFITKEYGKGFYKLRTSSIEKPKGEVSCTGSNTRRGFSPRLRGLK